MWDRDEWDEFCERAITALVLVTVALNAVFFGGVRNPEFMVGTLAALVLWIARFWLNPSHRLLLHPVLWPGLGFVAYAAWRASRVDVPYYAQMELLQVCSLAILFIIVLHNLHRQDTTLWVTHALVGTGCLIAGYAVLQLARQSDSVLWLQQPLAYTKRAGGTFVNPNHLAGFLTLLIPLALSVVFVGRTTPLVKILHAYSALVMLCGVAVTMSRGGWVATAFGLTILAGWLTWKRRGLRIPLAILAIGLLFGADQFVSKVNKAKARIDNLAPTGNIDSGGTRWFIWRPALKMWQDHLEFGVGPAQFDVHFPQYRPSEIQARPEWVHNEYLNLLVDYGAVGGVFFLACAGVFGWGIWRTNKYVERGTNDLGQRLSNRTAFFTGSTVGLGSLAVHSAVEFNIHIPAIAGAAVVLGGVLASNLRFATERFWVTPRIWSRLLVSVAAIGALGWMVPRTLVAGREGFYLNRASGVTNIVDSFLDDLKLAAETAPGNPLTAYRLGDNLRRLSFNGDADWKERGTQATQWLEKSVQLNPHDPEPQIALARTLHWLGETNRASIEFDKALKIGPNSVEVVNQVAWNRLVQGKTNEAKGLYDKSVEWQWWSNPAIGQKAYLETKGYK
jgi:O-antigen ligase